VAAISLTGGVLTAVGLALIAIGAYALARPTRTPPSEDPVIQASAETAATVAEPSTRDGRRTMGGTAAADRQAPASRAAAQPVDTTYEESDLTVEPSPAAADEVGLSASEYDDLNRILAHAGQVDGDRAAPSDRDRIAERMLEALKAEQARRRR
jgi:hypothetical protein